MSNRRKLPKAQFGPPLDLTSLSNIIGQINQNAPQEDIRAGRMSQQPFYNPFDVKWGQQQSPQINIAGPYSNTSFDPYATNVNTSTQPSRGALNLPQLINPDLLSQDTKQKNKRNKNLFGNFSKVSPFMNVGLGLMGAGIDYLDDRKKQKNWDKWFKGQSLPDNMYAVSPGGDRGDFDINEGIYRPNQLTPPNVGAGVAQYGGTMGKIKIRIKRNNDQYQMAYGGQAQGMALGLDLGQRDVYRHMPKEKADQVKTVIPEVSRDQANIEAEKGETVYGDLDNDGAFEHMKIGGKRHTQGGTPLNVPEGSFIYSDTKKMIIKDPRILKEFGMSPRKQGYTPAEIAKKYDVNKYKAIMEDPYVDNVRKSTAQIMIKSFNSKLAKLALVQESMKGFPTGIPDFVKEAYPELAQQMEEGLSQQRGDQANEDEQVMEQGLSDVDQEQMGEEEMGEQPMMEGEEEMEPSEEEMDEEYAGEEEEQAPAYAYGGGIFNDYMPQYQTGGANQVMMTQAELQKKYPWYKPYTASATPQGHISPTGESTLFDPSIPSQYNDVDRWVQQAQAEGKQIGSIEDLQKYVYQNLETADPGAINTMWTKYGHTAKGKDRNITNFADAAAGARTAFLLQRGMVPGYICVDGEVQQSTYQSTEARDAAGAKATDAEARAGCTKVTKKTPPKEQPYTGPGSIPGGGSSSRIPGKWFTPDIVNMGVAAAIPPKKYLPYMAQAPFEPNRLSLEDWRAQAAARQSMFNKSAETMGVYGSTTGQAANLSSMAGQQAEGLSGDIAQVNSRNVDRMNQFMQTERQRKDQFNLLGANRASELYKGNVIANQQYDNARRQYLTNIAKTYGQGFANKMYTGMLNAVNPYFKLDPRSGDSYWTGKGLGVGSLGMGSSGDGGLTDDQLAQFSELKTKYMSAMSEKAAEALALKQLGLSGGGNNASSQYAMAATFPAMYAGAMNFNLPGYTQEGE